MRDPRPLVDGEATDFERQLLSAARQEQPSPELVARMEHALGIVGVGGGIGVTASESGPAGAKLGVKTGALAAKSAVVLALVAGGVIGARLLLVHPAVVAHRAAEPVVSPAAVVKDEAAAATAPEGNGAGAEVAPASAGAVIVAPGAGPRLGATSTLRGEIVLIDGARDALAAGSSARAMRLLHQYDVRYPKGTLGPEALVVRIEALDRSGQRARARALARTFIAEHPSSPLVERIARLHLGPEGR